MPVPFHSIQLSFCFRVIQSTCGASEHDGLVSVQLSFPFRHSGKVDNLQSEAVLLPGYKSNKSQHVFHSKERTAKHSAQTQHTFANDDSKCGNKKNCCMRYAKKSNYLCCACAINRCQCSSSWWEEVQHESRICRDLSLGL